MEEENKKDLKEEKGKRLIALKDFTFSFGKDVYEIKKGEEVKVPKILIANLKTEKVIK